MTNLAAALFILAASVAAPAEPDGGVDSDGAVASKMRQADVDALAAAALLSIDPKGKPLLAGIPLGLTLHEAQSRCGPDWLCTEKRQDGFGCRQRVHSTGWTLSGFAPRKDITESIEVASGTTSLSRACRAFTLVESELNRKLGPPDARTGTACSTVRERGQDQGIIWQIGADRVILRVFREVENVRSGEVNLIVCANNRTARCE